MPAVRTVAIANQKGGSGKTTTAVNLAAALAELGQRVLLLDLDPQASASAWLGATEDGSRGLLEVFTRNASLSDLITPTSLDGLDLIAGSSWLMTADKQLAGEVGAETLLRAALEALPPRRWAFVLIDCPPSLGLLALSALVAAREVLVPVETHAMAVTGLAAFGQTVDRVRERLNPSLHLSAILPCRVDNRTNLSREIVDLLRARFGPLVLKTTIRENVRLAEAPSHRQPITRYAPDSAGAEDYRAAAKELLARGRSNK